MSFETGVNTIGFEMLGAMGLSLFCAVGRFDEGRQRRGFQASDAAQVGQGVIKRTERRLSAGWYACFASIDIILRARFLAVCFGPGRVAKASSNLPSCWHPEDIRFVISADVQFSHSLQRFKNHNSSMHCTNVDGFKESADVLQGVSTV